MTKRAYLLVVLVCLICLGGCREKPNNNYTATMPRLGDRAVVRLYEPTTKDFRKINKPGGLRHIDLQVSCTGATGHKRELTVSLIRKHKKALPWYKVIVNYDTVSVDKRVAVYHLGGMRAKRDKRINGWSVPFYYMLNLNTSAFSGKCYIREPLADAVIARIDRMGNICKTRVTVYSNKPKIEYVTQESQKWISGDWLWCGVKGNQNSHYDFWAIRKSPPGPSKDPF